MTHHKPQKPALRSLYLWHRYLGLGVALLVLLMVVTGILLNHTDEFKLDQHKVQPRWMLAWYGIAPEQGRFFRLGDRWLSQWGGTLYLDAEELSAGPAGELRGAVALPRMLILAEHNALMLLTPAGQLIERLDGLDGVPGGITAIAPGGDERLLLQADGKIVSTDLTTGRWEAAASPAAWRREHPAPESLKQAILKQRPGAALPLERVILDLHSGRLFGAMGSYVMDAAAVVMLFNAATGVILWWKRRRNQRQRQVARKRKLSTNRA